MPIDDKNTIMNIPRENILWHYMDIPSFLALLTKKSLTFIRADLFEDKFEGIWPQKAAKEIDKKIIDNFSKLGSEYKSNFSESLNILMRKSTYINCWCKENSEMVHMWKIYSKENGIAIETNYERLKESINTVETVCPTEIRYVDFQKDNMDWKSNTLTVFTVKKIEYKAESEFRLIMSSPDLLEEREELVKSLNDERYNYRSNLYEKIPAVYCPVEIEKLISKLYISPFAPTWYTNLIKDILERFGLKDVEVIKSDI